MQLGAMMAASDTDGPETCGWSTISLRNYWRTDLNTHLQELLEGLEIPEHDWWIQQPPEALKKVGQAIAAQAKRAHVTIKDLGTLEFDDGMED